MAPPDQALAALRLAFFMPARAASFSEGLALKRTVAPAFTATFSPVRGFSAVRLGVSRTVKEPKSGREKRPVSTISVLMASMMSVGQAAGGGAGHLGGVLTMTSVRNFFDTHGTPSGSADIA